MTFTVPVQLAPIPSWDVHQPVVYRFLSKPEFVERFFEDGSLRLSSLQKFRQHEDERRLDIAEGWSLFVNRTRERGGQTVFVWGASGFDAYILCGSMMIGPAAERFGQSYIRINDTCAFAIAVAREVPGFFYGQERPCRYGLKTILVDEGYIDLEKLKDQQGQLPAEQLFAFTRAREYMAAFMKHIDFADQAEYRFLWHTREPLQDYLEIKVPEAIQFCSRPAGITD